MFDEDNLAYQRVNLAQSGINFITKATYQPVIDKKIFPFSHMRFIQISRILILIGIISYRATAATTNHHLIMNPGILCCQHIEVETKWPPFCRWHFEMNFLEWKCLNQYFIVKYSWRSNWVGARQVTSHYMNQWWTYYLKHICITQPQ